MMKFVIVLLAFTAVFAVPVAQVPEAEAPKVAEQPKAVEAPKVEEPKAVEQPKAEAPKAEEQKAVAVVEAPKAEIPKITEELKGQALSQVMKAISGMASPLGGEEFNLLKDIMSKGTEILAQAEQKAEQIHSHPEFQNLIQADSLFGIKNDGSIDADVATNQLSQLMNLLTGTQMSDQEKNLIHELIGGFSGLFAPIVSGSDSMNSDLEKLAQQFTSKFDKIQDKLGATPKDKLLEPQTLLSVMTEDDGAIDTALLSSVTEKFMDKISSQFEKVMGTIEKIQQTK